MREKTMISSTTEFPVNTVTIIAINDMNEAIAVKEDTGRYFMGDVDGDVFVNCFNVKFKGGRDDVRAVSHFVDTYGYEAA